MQKITTVIKASWQIWKQAKLAFSGLGVLAIALSVLQIYVQEGMKTFNANGGVFPVGYILVAVLALLVPTINVTTNALGAWVMDRRTGDNAAGLSKMSYIIKKLGAHRAQKTIAFFFFFQLCVALNYLFVNHSESIVIGVTAFIVTGLELFLIPLSVYGEDTTWLQALALSPKILVKEWLTILLLWILATITVIASMITFGAALIIAIPVYEITILVISSEYCDQSTATPEKNTYAMRSR